MKYRKKPVIIDAAVYKPGMEDGFMEEELGYFGAWTPENGEWHKTGVKMSPFIRTLEGPHFVSEGDYIITGVKGERYPCKPDIFKLTYEPVLDEEANKG